MSVDQKIVERIQKLLARGKSENFHEAQLANEMAYKLMTEHKLTHEDVFGKNPDIIETRIDGDKFLEIWRWGLLTACAWGRDAHTVRIVERFPNGMHKTFAVVIGSKDSVKAAIYLFQAFERDIDDRVEMLVSGRDLHGRAENESYRRGAVVAIQERILTKKKQPKQELRERALVLIRNNEEKIKEHVQKEYADAVKPRMWKETDYTAFDRGYRFGQSLTMANGQQKQIRRASSETNT